MYYFIYILPLNWTELELIIIPLKILSGLDNFPWVTVVVWSQVPGVPSSGSLQPPIVPCEQSQLTLISGSAFFEPNNTGSSSLLKGTNQIFEFVVNLILPFSK